MRGRGLQLLWLLASLLLAPAALAREPIVVQSAFVNVRGGVFELNARTIFPLNEDVRAALADGATISLELRATVEKKRRYWWDATLVDVTLQRELSWNAVSERYILREPDRTEQQSIHRARPGAQRRRTGAGLARGGRAAARSRCHLCHPRARRHSPRPPARRFAHADVLVRRLESQQRLVLMDIAPVKRWRGYGIIAIAAVLVFAVLLLLARSVENSAQFSKWQLLILGVNIAGVVVMAVLLARKLRQLVRDYRHHVPGSRLTARTVAIFGTLVVVPLLVIYLFSLEFLNRGIDSWFRVEIRQGLNDALVLSRSALDVRTREQGRRTEDLASALRERSNGSLAAALDEDRRVTGARELIVFGSNGEVLAASIEAREALIDPQIPREMLMQVRGGRSYLNLEPMSDGGYLISAAAPIPDGSPDARRRFLVARHELPRELAELANAAQQAFTNYNNLAYVRPMAEIPVSHRTHAGAAAGDAVRHLHCHPFRAAAHAAGARSDPRNARGGKATSAPGFHCPRAMKWASWCSRSTT